MAKKTVAVRMEPTVWAAFAKSAEKRGLSRQAWLDKMLRAQLDHDGIPIDNPETSR